MGNVFQALSGRVHQKRVDGKTVAGAPINQALACGYRSKKLEKSYQLLKTHSVLGSRLLAVSAILTVILHRGTIILILQMSKPEM